ncbi:beta strand repeat-containing protein, partial [Candidatus Omnitrophota bacterium]
VCANLTLDYVQTADITLIAEFTNYIIGTDWASTFSGTYNGNNYTISNLTINKQANYIGLFGYTDSATIQNVGLIANDVTGKAYVGGLVGYNRVSSTITNSYATGDVTGSGNYVGGLVGYMTGSATITNSYATGAVEGSGGYVGGLVGRNSSSSTITNSYATGDVTGSGDYVGGLVGQNSYSSTITNSYATGDVTGDDYVGGLVGQNYGCSMQEGCVSSITNSYATGDVTGDDYVGGLVGYNYTSCTITNNSYATGSVTGDDYVGGLVGYNNGTISNSYYNIDDATITIGGVVFNGLTFGGIYGAQFDDWVADKSLTITDYFTKNGDYYEIGTVQGLKDFLGFSCSAEKFRLSANIDLINDADFYIPYMTVEEFDGNGKTISNLSISINNRYKGFFGQVDGTTNGTTIKNVGLVDVDITANDHVGGLVGYMTGSATITNSYATGAVEGTSYVGGLVGNNSSSNITNSYAAGSVTGDDYVGGLVGYNNSGTISNSYYNIDDATITIGGVVFNGPTLGGIYNAQYDDWVADKSLTITDYLTKSGDYYEIGTVQDLKDFLGFYWCAEKFRLSANIDLINDADFYIPYMTVEEFDGNGKTISNLSVSLDRRYIGFFGVVDGTTNGTTIKNVGLVDVDITADDYVGGLAGYITGSATITNSYATGAVTGDYYVGGLAGYNNSSTITNSYATGSVTGNRYLGGLVGYNNSSTITNSYATGAVTGNSYYVGGLVGYDTSSNITNSYATGAVEGNSNTGGLVGYNRDSTITNSYATGSVTGASSVGGLVGDNGYSNITNSYATGAVTGSYMLVGGLLGYNVRSTITNSYATGAVEGDYAYVGGLVGQSILATITNSYATGSVTVTGAGNYSGGLVGNNASSNITNSYATGAVTGSVRIGGLVGYNSGSSTITNSYATGDTTGSSNVGRLIGYDDASYEAASCGVYASSGGNPNNDIGNTGASVDEQATAISDFYDQENANITVVYTGGSNPWDF